MNSIWYVIAITAIAGVGGTGLGGISGVLFRKNSSKIISLLLSFAAGVMLSIVCFDMIPHTIRPGNERIGDILISVSGILAGYLIIYLLNWVIDKVTNHEIDHIDKDHPQTADSLDELIHSNHFQKHKVKNKGLFLAGIVMASAIALHNIPEGMVIGASFAVNHAGSGLTIALVIGLHNVPEGMAVSVPLIMGGMSRWKAILITALSGATTIIGAIAGYYLGSMGQIALSLSLGFASGAMLYVVLGELIPEAILMWRSKLPAFAILLGILLGIIIIYV